MNDVDREIERFKSARRTGAILMLIGASVVLFAAYLKFGALIFFYWDASAEGNSSEGTLRKIQILKGSSGESLFSSLVLIVGLAVLGAGGTMRWKAVSVLHQCAINLLIDVELGREVDEQAANRLVATLQPALAARKYFASAKSIGMIVIGLALVALGHSCNYDWAPIGSACSRPIAFAFGEFYIISLVGGFFVLFVLYFHLLYFLQFEVWEYAGESGGNGQQGDLVFWRTVSLLPRVSVIGVLYWVAYLMVGLLPVTLALLNIFLVW